MDGWTLELMALGSGSKALPLESNLEENADAAYLSWESIRNRKVAHDGGSNREEC
jgi:hypothetical protein